MSTPVIEKTPVSERLRQRTTKIRGARPGVWTYVALAVVFVSAAFPLWWSFIIGSGDASSLRERPWWPGGNFIDNALAVVSNPAVNFWPALWNSIYSSFLIAAAVVITSTLAGWAFSKLRFKGSVPLLAFVIATMAVPQQLRRRTAVHPVLRPRLDGPDRRHHRAGTDERLRGVLDDAVSASGGA